MSRVAKNTHTVPTKSTHTGAFLFVAVHLIERWLAAALLHSNRGFPLGELFILYGGASPSRREANTQKAMLRIPVYANPRFTRIETTHLTVFGFANLQAD